MSTELLMVEGREIPLDQDDCLINLTDWSEAVAQALATREGIELTDAHWEVLYLLQQFYEEFQLSPANRALVAMWGQVRKRKRQQPLLRWFF